MKNKAPKGLQPLLMKPADTTVINALRSVEHLEVQRRFRDQMHPITAAKPTTTNPLRKST